MSREERAAWDERFRSGDHAGIEPDPFLLELEEYWTLLPASGRALDVACGVGRNAIWIAQKGFTVAACDISLEALRRAKALAADRGVQLDLFCQDLETASFRPNRFDLIVCFFHLQREIFPILKSALRPNGLIVYKTYTVDQQRFQGRPRHSMHMLQPQELLEVFRDFRVLFYREVMEKRGVAQMIAQKS